jgi:heme-degrading monooxygenase HmoA/ketosteroid isomerase-like protein
MVISLTTSRVTPEQAQQVEEFLQGFLPKVQREPGVVAIYHFHRLDPGESTTLIVWETDEARQAYRESELIEEALAFERSLGLASDREAYPLTQATHGVIQHDMTDPQAVAERWTQAITAHDLEAAVACFAPDYGDEAPARRGESFVGRDQIRANFAALFQDIPDLRAELLHAVTQGDTVWVEWRMSGTRRDGTPMEFVGVNIFGVQDQQFVWGRIYTELVRDAGGIGAQIERMTKGESGRQP